MGIVINCGSAGVHLNQIGVIGHEKLFFAAQRIINIHKINLSDIVIPNKKIPPLAFQEAGIKLAVPL